MVHLLSEFACYFCVIVWTEQSGWRLWGSRGRPDSHSKLHPQIQKNNYRSDRTRKDKNQQQYKHGTNKGKHTTNIQANMLILFCQTKKRAKSTYARTYKPRETFWPNTRRLFFFCARACLCTYNLVGNGAECSLLTLCVACQRKG